MRWGQRHSSRASSARWPASRPVNMRLASEEAVRERRDERDFDEQTDDGFACGEPRQRVAEADARREEAPPVEAADAEDERLIPGEMWRGQLRIKQVGAREQTDDENVGNDAAYWSIPIPGHGIQQARPQPAQPLSLSAE